MSRQPPPRDVAPVAFRARLRYSKGGRLRFASTRDFQRSLERAIRRAQLPIAFSAGFSPHPKISYTNSVPTGAGSDAEYVELGLTERVEPEVVQQSLNASLPEGFRVREVVPAATSDFASRLEASTWRIELPGVAVASAADAVARLLGQERVIVERVTKKGTRELDVRAAILALTTAPADAGRNAEESECAILHMVVRHTTPAVRPNDVLTALKQAGGLETPQAPRTWRRSQGPLSEDGITIGDPLAPDRTLASGS